MKPAVPCPAPALQEDSPLSPAMPSLFVEPDEEPQPVTPVRVIVPYGDFLERRKERYGAASEFARQDAEGSRNV
jgi:hypothetical protein